MWDGMAAKAMRHQQDWTHSYNDTRTDRIKTSPLEWESVTMEAERHANNSTIFENGKSNTRKSMSFFPRSTGISPPLNRKSLKTTSNLLPIPAK